MATAQYMEMFALKCNISALCMWVFCVVCSCCWSARLTFLPLSSAPLIQILSLAAAWKARCWLWLWLSALLYLWPFLHHSRFCNLALSPQEKAARDKYDSQIDLRSYPLRFLCIVSVPILFLKDHMYSYLISSNSFCVCSCCLRLWCGTFLLTSHTYREHSLVLQRSLSTLTHS